MKKRFTSIVVIIAIVALLAGVWYYRHVRDRTPATTDGSEFIASSPETPVGASEPAALPVEETAVSKGFPMTVKDMMNNSVTLPQKPEKIAVISGPLLEMFCGLGGKPICTVHPDEIQSPLQDAEQLPSIGRASNPDIIAILELEPDLVIAEAGVQNEIVVTLQKSHIKVLALKSKGDANRDKSLGIMKAIAGLD